MAIVDSLYHRGPDRHVESWMPMEEVLRRVAARFPLAVIDRERADQKVRDDVAQLVELDAHNVVLESHRAMEGHVAYVTVREDTDGPHLHFFLTRYPHSIDIDYDDEEDRDVCRTLLEALAAALPEYDLVSEAPDEPRDLSPDDLPAAVRDAVSGMHLRWEGDVAILGAGSHAAGEPFPQEKNAARHWCDDSEFVILDLKGFAPVHSGPLLELVMDITSTAEDRDREVRLCCPPDMMAEGFTRYFQHVGGPIHATLAEAMAAEAEE